MSRSRATVLALALALASAGLHAQSILVYTDLDASALFSHPGVSSMSIDFVDEFGWLLLSPQDFAGYDLIWLGQKSTAAFPYGAINFTKGAWGPIVTGHVFVSGLDLEAHRGRPGARQLVTEVVDWLVSAAGTSIYVASDRGTRGLDFLPWGISGCAGGGCFAQDTATPAFSMHPALAGSSAASLSGWGTSSISRITSHPPGWEPLVLGRTGEVICLASPAQVQWPSCIITGPPLAFYGGDIPIDFDADDPQGTPLDTSFQWTTDGGGVWHFATPAPASLLPNPALALTTPVTGARFIWDSLADGVGLTSALVAMLRVLADDGGFSGECFAPIIIDNVPQPPLCSIFVGPGIATGDYPFTVDVSSTASTVDVLVEHSLDAGASFQTSTMTAASPTPNPASGVAPGALGFVWDTIVDGVGLAGPSMPVVMRISVTTARYPAPGDCLTSLLIDNSAVPACRTGCGDCNRDGQPIGVLDALVAARLGLGLVAPSPEQATCCDVDSTGSIDVIDALLLAQRAAALPVTLSCP